MSPCSLVGLTLLVFEVVLDGRAALRRMFGGRASEQALVRLTPAAPSAATFNRVLGRYFLIRCVATWCAFSVLSVAALPALGASAGVSGRPIQRII